jgi:hypothetical protein
MDAEPDRELAAADVPQRIMCQQLHACLSA